VNYKWLVTNLYVRRLDDGATIPCVSDNCDFLAFQVWQAAGNTPLPVDVPVPPAPADLNAVCIAATTAPAPPQFGFDLQRAFIAHVVSTEAYRLGVNPGALTGPQLAAIRNRIANIYQAL
jgi:hypothetical protein